MENYRLAYEYEEQMEHRKWMKEIPYIQFPADWKVQITPPFAGAVVRFRVKKDKAEVSIYLDCYDRLGCYGEPYWEVYPHEGDVYRCDMADTESLLNAIKYSILEQNSRYENEPQHDAKLPVSGSVLEQIRQAFADYRRSEGCSCCRDMDVHEEAEKRLAELLKPEPYEDGSGWDWSKYCTERTEDL